LNRFLFVSSIAAVGSTGDSGIYDEMMIPNPESDYGKSKLRVENELKKTAGKIPYTIVRLPLVYGPRCKRGLYTGFKIANKGFHLVVSKTYTNVGFVKDIVKGMEQAANNPNAIGQAYFLGEDRIYSSDEIAEHIIRTLNKKTIKIKIPYFFLYSITAVVEGFTSLAKAGPVLHKRSLSIYLKSNWRFSMKKAREELNYKTDFPLPEGLKITADWYQRNNFLN
jgi:UDP-glucose 4-epimerase